MYKRNIFIFLCILQMYCDITYAQIQEKVDFFIKAISIQFDEKSVFRNNEKYTDVIPLTAILPQSATRYRRTEWLH